MKTGQFFTAALMTLITLAQAQWTTLNFNYTNLTLDDIYASPSGDTIIAVGTDLVNNFTGHTLYSYDGGISWDTTSFNQGYLFKGISFATPGEGVIAALGSSGCALRTTDGGVTWVWNWCDQTYSGVYDIHFTDRTTGYMAGYGDSQFDDGTIYKTSDAGQTWSNITGSLTDMPFEYINIPDQNVMYGGSFLFFHENLYRSTDGGFTWDSLDVTATGCQDVYFHNPSTGILLGRDGEVYRTTDSAKTWVSVGSFPSVPNFSLRSIVFTDSSNGYAVGGTNSQTRFVKTTDGGLSWSLMVDVMYNVIISKLRAFGPRVYGIGTTGEVVMTQLPGIGWDEHMKESVQIFPNPFHAQAQLKIPSSLSIRSFHVYNSLGIKVKIRFQQNEKGLMLEKGSLAAGLYTYKLEFDSQQVLAGRFVIL